MWRTLGHKNQKSFFDNALASGNLSHAYLFCGPSQIGKRTLAIEFAQKILKVTDARKFVPDLIIAGEEKLKVENIRELISELSLRPYEYEKKVAIIDNFDTVTEEAASSILKTLEEPSSSTIIILIAQNKKVLLPTILSRTQVINFNRFSAEEIKEYSGSKNLSADMLESVDGRLGKALRLSTDPDLKEKLSEQKSDFDRLRKDTVADRIWAMKKYSELETEPLNELLHNWIDVEHYRANSGNPEKYSNLKLLIEALSGLRQNFNKKLVLERLFLGLV